MTLQQFDQVKHPTVDIWSAANGVYAIRQKKMVHFEAPFLFLIVGRDIAILQDTGAVATSNQCPLPSIVSELIRYERAGDRRLVVIHSHSHEDHTTGDEMFADNDGQIDVVPPSLGELERFFGVTPDDEGILRVDLGERPLLFFSIPGHDTTSTALYDSESRLLFTNDTFYPGRLYVENWEEYRRTAERLLNFSRRHPIDSILGTHVEMSRRGFDEYPEGTMLQPNELPLPLTICDLEGLSHVCRRFISVKEKIVCRKFVITPT